MAAFGYAGAFLAVLPIALWRSPPRIAHGRALAVLVVAGFGFTLAPSPAANSRPRRTARR